MLAVPVVSQDSAHDMAGNQYSAQTHSSISSMDMEESTPDWLPSPHVSSGTGWQPAVTPDSSWMKSFQGWDLMAHGVVFVGYNQQGGPRGAGKAESVNWLMLMEQHPLWKGT